MTDKRRLGTKKDYADLRGWNKAYLSKADVKERLAGAMVIDTADGKKKLDFDKADKIFEETADPARKKPNTKKKHGRQHRRCRDSAGRYTRSRRGGAGRIPFRPD